MLTSGNIPSLIQGVSQQPKALRLPSQLQSQDNCYSSPVEGLTNRQPTEHIAKISNTSMDGALIHTINRTSTQRYKAIISSGLVQVFDLAGNEKTVNTVDETLQILFSAASVINGSTYYIAKAPGETSIDFVVTGITTATVKLQLSNDGSNWVDADTRTTNGTTAGIALGSYVYMRAIVSAYTSGTINCSVTYKHMRYLVSPIPQTEMRALTVADYTFIVDTQQVPAMKPDLSTVRDHEGLVFIKSGEYASEYQIFIDGTQRATYTTSATDALTIQTTNIATDLYNDLVTWGGAGFVFTLIGSVIHIKKTTGDFKLRVVDDQGGTSTGCFKDRTEKFSNLPTEAPDGFVIAIDSDPTTEQDTYYVKAVVNQAGETFGPVTWQECVKPGVEYIIDPATMPHALVHEIDDTFTFTTIAWDDRVCGDDDSNSVPTFIGATINDMFFYKNRLGLLADENFILSETANYFNFWRTTVTQIKDSDVVDSSSKHTKVSILKNVVPFNKSLVLFSDQTQFELPGDVAMTPKTVRCDVVSEFESVTTVRPVNAGKVIYFLFNRGSYDGIKELFVSQSNADNMDADDITAHVPAYIPAGVFSISVSTLEGVTALLTTGDRAAVYVYKTEWQGEKKVQSAWFRWDLSNYAYDPAATIILSADFIESTLYLLVQRAGEVFLEKIRLIPNRSDDYVSYVTLLDRRITDAQLAVAPTYNAGTNITTLTLPYVIDSTQMVVVTRGVADNTGYADVGRSLQIVSATVASTQITVRGNFATNPLWIGQRYLCEAELSTIYKRSQAANGSQIVDGTGNLQLLRGVATYSDSGLFTISVTPQGRTTSNYIFTGRLTGDINNVIGAVALATGRFRFGILSNNERVSIKINSNGFLRFRITSIDWEGEYTKRSAGV